MLDTVPLRDVRGLGGKLGEAVVSWSNAETASDLKVSSLAGLWMHAFAEGFDPFAAGRRHPLYGMHVGVSSLQLGRTFRHMLHNSRRRRVVVSQEARRTHPRLCPGCA